MDDNFKEFVQRTKATGDETEVVLDICEWNLNAALELFYSHPRPVWTALPRTWTFMLSGLSGEMREKVLNEFLPYFPSDAFEEGLQGLDAEDCEYLSIIALRAFSEWDHEDFQREKFVQMLQLGKTELLPLFQEWAKELKEIKGAAVEGLECGAARERLKVLLNQTMPNVVKANAGLRDYMQDIISLRVPVDDDDMQTALHVAAMFGDLDLVNILIAHKAKLGVKDLAGNTALHVGICHPDIVGALLAAGEQEDIWHEVNGKRQTALHLCRNVESARLLLRVCPTLLFQTDEKEETALHTNVNDAGMVSVLLGAIKDSKKLEKFVQRINYECRNALHLCTDAESARLLLQASPTVLSSTDRKNRTTLHHRVNNAEMVNVLLDAARTSGQLARFVEQKDSKGKSALHFCTNAASARLLLSACPSAALLKCEEGNTPLHSHAARGSVDICRLLLEEYQVDVNAVNEMGQTPLQRACLFRQVEIVDMLLKHSAQVLVRDYEYCTALHLAMSDGAQEDDMQDAHQVSVRRLPENKIPLVVKLLLTQEDDAVVAELVAGRDVAGRTALNYCMLLSIEYSAVADMLMMAGANGAAQDNEGNTVLHLALGYSVHLELAIHLIIHWGVSIHVKNRDGRTALDLVDDIRGKQTMKRASTLARAVTLRFAARPRAVPSPWKRFPKELFGELCSFLV